MASEDEKLLQETLQAERTSDSETLAIARVWRGLAERTFLSGVRTRHLRPLASAAVFVAAALVVSGVILAGHLSQAPRVKTVPSPPSVASSPSASSQPTPATYPATFVAVVDGGLELVDSTTGAVVRTLTTVPSGDDAADYGPTVTGDGATVYFTYSVGSCGAAGSSDAILSVATAGGPTSVVEKTPSQAADLAPVVSSDGKMLAWLRSSCDKQQDAIYVQDLATGAQRAIPIPSGAELDSMAWETDDQHLLVVWATSSGPNVTILDTATATSATDGTSLDVQLCASPFPRFLADGTFVALACPWPTPTLPEGTSCTFGCPVPSSPAVKVAVFDATTGAELRVLGTLPSLTAQSEDMVWFSFSPDGSSAIWTLLGPTTPNVWRWSGGQVVQIPLSAPQGVAW